MTRHIAKLLIGFALMVPFVVHAQGFGTFSQKKVLINRLLPPTVNLKGKRIRVEASAAAVQKDSALLQDLLRTKLITMIQKDPRFILDENNAETILRFTVTNYYTEKWIVGAGTEHAHDAYRGKIEVSYQALNTRNQVALDSENLTETAGMDLIDTSSLFSLHTTMLSQKKRAAEMSENETRDQMVSGIVERMGKRVAPVDEPFEALLPGKKLEPLSSLAVNHRWGALEEQADKAEKLPKPDEDCYRLYLVALAKEAQAYELTHEANDQTLGKRNDITPQQAEADVQHAQKYFDEAGAIYKEILATNPREKEFRAGDTRIEEAETIYATIARFKQEAARKQEAISAASKSIQAETKPTRSLSEITGRDFVVCFCGHRLLVDVHGGRHQVVSRGASSAAKNWLLTAIAFSCIPQHASST